MAPTAEGPDISFPDSPGKAYFCCGAAPPVAPHGKLSLCFASGSANVSRLVVAEGSDAHFLCSSVLSFNASLLEHFCPEAADSRASMSVEGAVGGGDLQGYNKVPTLPGMIAEPSRAANEFTETGSSRPSLK